MLTEIKNALSQLKVPRVWKNLDELLQTKEYKKFLHEEYPFGAVSAEDGISRRDFFKMIGASVVMASLSGCSRQPEEAIVPYVKSVEEIVPGRPLLFATAMSFNGHHTGLLVTQHMGRPTRIEGNALHPDSLGAASIFHQASILDFYDPERSKQILFQKKPAAWEAFVDEMKRSLSASEADGGQGLHILTETVTSPTLLNQLGKFLQKYPKAKWHVFDAVSRSEAKKAQKAVFGRALDTVYHFDKAKIVVSLDSDFMTDTPGHLRHARQFMQNRKDPKNHAAMNRFYAAEPSPTVTGSVADHRLPVSASRITAFAEYLAKSLGIANENLSKNTLNNDEKKWLNAALEDLRSHHGAGIVIAGTHQPAWVHALVYCVNEALGHFGKTMDLIEAVDGTKVARSSIEDLVHDLRTGQVQTLLTLGGNPVYDAPADYDLARLFPQVPQSIHLGLYANETSRVSRWHLPEAHFLESFSDGLASDGTVSIAQPLIQPLYGGRSSHEILALFSGEPSLSSYEAVRRTWKEKWNGLDFEFQWKKALHDGVVTGTASKPVDVSFNKKFSKKYLSVEIKDPAGEAIQILHRPDPALWDGRFANNGWLQELPKPISKLTWGNAALISPAWAEKMDLSNGSVIEISVKGQTLQAPVWILPGQDEKTVVLPLGYGRKTAGSVGNNIGFNAYTLRFSKFPVWAYSDSISKTGKKQKLATTQNHHNMEGRDLVRSASMEKYLENPRFAQGENTGPLPSLYPAVPKGDYAWGMVINLNACIGCNACVIGCQSENNIPVVGKNEVSRGREMQWLRIDNYFEGPLENPDIHHQPVPCMHCENAPCEPVCPVGATNHSPDGINQMIYNRCIGTRYCSNNCPYKVRHFNFFEYADRHLEPMKLMRNPDVTVRARGVMEKCTFCVQRINHARIDAKEKGIRIGPNEVITACQAACPTQAIVFGDISNPESEAAKLKEHELNYVLLEALGTKPRVSYHAKVKNIHPWIGEHTNASI